MQFGSGVLGVEPPVDGGPRRIALGLVGVDGPLQSGSIRTEPLLSPLRLKTLALAPPDGPLRPSR